jgi:hypothetical protein
MAAQDAQVQKIINDAVRCPGETGCCAAITAAFRYLQAQRRIPGGSVDENLAVAEFNGDIYSYGSSYY